MEISVVVPVYGCKGALLQLHERLVRSLIEITKDFEIILVNDNCPQNSWEVIEKICEKDKRVVGINLSRNFGQIKAITAGLDNVKGNWIIVMDCDLQDRPEEIPRLYKKALEGYDMVFARRANRKDKALKIFISKVFYKVYDYFTEGNFDNTICNFSICKKIVIDNYCKMREQNRAFTLFLKWLGFRQTSIDVEHNERLEGKSSYNLKRKIKMASDFITAQSNKPLRVSINIGFTISAVSFIYIVYLVISYFLNKKDVAGWTSTIVSIYFMGGLLLMNMGLMGMYIGNVFNETKNRPIYVIRDILNKDMEEKK